MRHNTTKLLLTTVMLALCCSPVWPGASASLSRVGDLPIITLTQDSDTHYNLGREYGRLCATELRAETVAAMSYMRQIVWLGFWYGVDIRARAMALEPSIPQSLRDECRGLAEGATAAYLPTTYQDVITANTLPDTVRGVIACSGFAAFGAATLGGFPVVGRNLDWVDGNYLHQAGVVIIFELDDVTVAGVAFVGMVGALTAMNNHGLCISVLDSTTNDPYLHVGRSSMMMTNMHVARIAANVDEAVQKFNTVGFTYGVNLLLADPTTVKVLEKAPYANAVRTVADGEYADRLWVTNHYVKLTGQGQTPGNDSLTRYGRLTALAAVGGEFDPARIGGAMGDTANPPRCIYKALTAANVNDVATLQSVIFEPARLRLHVFMADAVPAPATPSYEIVDLPPGPPAIGDFNEDEQLDGRDLALFMQAWRAAHADPPAYDALYDIAPLAGLFPLVTSQPDGAINSQDAAAMVDAWVCYR